MSWMRHFHLFCHGLAPFTRSLLEPSSCPPEGEKKLSRPTDRIGGIGKREDGGLGIAPQGLTQTKALELCQILLLLLGHLSKDPRHLWEGNL